MQVILQLNQQFKVEPCFTQLVWQKLEEQNHEFFRAYYTRLKLKDQIVLFNHLLDEQIKMFQRMPRSVMQVPGELSCCCHIYVHGLGSPLLCRATTQFIPPWLVGVPSAPARPAMPVFAPGQPQSMAPEQVPGSQGQGAAGLTGYSLPAS